ncbi:MAG: hypothetical protein L0Z53_06605 [Acidobacteriales bacterium]|nr:hypothetical protein [Terriglobales bacterium]
MKATEAVLEALELRVQLRAAEQACEELGKRLSFMLRGFSGDELLAYAERTEREDGDELQRQPD